MMEKDTKGKENDTRAEMSPQRCLACGVLKVEEGVLQKL